LRDRRRGNPLEQVYEDETVLAFYDIAPQAPMHFLVIPKEHIDSAADISEAKSGLISHIFVYIAKLAGRARISDGFRVVTNVGEQGGQTVRHLHFHVLAGRDMTWPPG
jgi:histidine triad (HIT) family protein